VRVSGRVGCIHPAFQVRRIVEISAVLAVLILSGATNRSALPKTSQLATSLDPGDLVSMECQHVEILVDGTSDCHDGSSDPDLCLVSTCSFSIDAVPDSGYSFCLWTASADAYLGSYPTKGIQSTEQVTPFWVYGSDTDRYSGTLIASTTCDTVTFLTADEYGQPLAKISFDSTTYDAGQKDLALPGYTYPISPAWVAGSNYSWEWTTTAGSVTDPTSSSAELTVTQSGYLILDTNSTGSWGGYKLATSSVDQVYTEFRLPGTLSWTSGPGEPSDTPQSVAFWIGMGGVNHTSSGAIEPLWQGGIDMAINSSTSTLWIVPFVECLGSSFGCPSPSATDTYCQNYWYGGVCWGAQMKIGVTDTIEVTMTYLPSDQITLWRIQDATTGALWAGEGPTLEAGTKLTTGEWVGESFQSAYVPQNDSGGSATWTVHFTNVQINSESTTFSQAVSAVMGKYRQREIGTIWVYGYVSPTYISSIDSFAVTNTAPA
jgi:hypothetical protein